MSPTNSSTAAALRGAARHTRHTREAKEHEDFGRCANIEGKKKNYNQPVNRMIQRLIDLHTHVKKKSYIKKGDVSLTAVVDLGYVLFKFMKKMTSSLSIM